MTALIELLRSLTALAFAATGLFFLGAGFSLLALIAAAHQNDQQLADQMGKLFVVSIVGFAAGAAVSLFMKCLTWIGEALFPTRE